MFASLSVQLVFAIVLGSGAIAPVADEPTKADVPAELSPKVKSLIEKTSSPSAEARASAAEELGKLGEEAAPAVPFLNRLLGDEGSVNVYRGEAISVRVEATVALAKIGVPAVEPCIAALGDPDAVYIKVKIVDVLGDLKDPRATPALINLLDDRDPNVRRAALRSLHTLRAPGLDTHFIRALNDKNANVRCEAAQILGKCGGTQAVEPLLKALDDDNQEVRSSAASALGELRDRRAVERLVVMMQDPRDHARGHAADALGKIGDARAVEPLLAALQDRQQPDGLRGDAARALGLLGDRRAEAPLVAVLKAERESPYLRVNVAFGLAELSGEGAISHLTAVVKAVDDSRWLRYRVAERIVSVTGGAVDDTAVVAALKGGYWDRNEFIDDDTDEERAERTARERETLEKVATNGKTIAVRLAANRMIRSRWGSHGADLLAVLYYAIALPSWVYCCRKSLKRYQFSLRSLFALMTLIAIGLPLIFS